MRWLSGFVLVLLVSLAAAPALAVPREHLALRKAAHAMLTQQRYGEAVKIYTDAAVKATDNDALQAHCLTEAAEITQAKIKDNEAALKLASEIRDPALSASLRLHLLEQGGQYAKVLEEFGDTDFSKWPVDVQMQSHASRAKAYLKTDQQEKAVADLDAGRQIVGSAPVRVWLCHELGQYYETKGDKDKAMEIYLYGTNVTQGYYAWRNRCLLSYSQLLLDRGDAKAALEALKDMDYSKLSNAYWIGSFYLLEADIQSSLGNNGQAAALLTKVIRLPGVVKIHKTIAEKRLEEISTKM